VTDLVQVATLLVALAGLVTAAATAVVAVLTAIRQGRALSALEHHVIVVHDLFNSRMTELMRLTAASSRAEGVRAGGDAARAEATDAAALKAVPPELRRGPAGQSGP
jgi:hypothetical protein